MIKRWSNIIHFGWWIVQNFKQATWNKSIKFNEGNEIYPMLPRLDGKVMGLTRLGSSMSLDFFSCFPILLRKIELNHPMTLFPMTFFRILFFFFFFFLTPPRPPLFVSKSKQTKKETKLTKKGVNNNSNNNS